MVLDYYCPGHHKARKGSQVGMQFPLHASVPDQSVCTLPSAWSPAPRRVQLSATLWLVALRHRAQLPSESNSPATQWPAAQRYGAQLQACGAQLQESPTLRPPSGQSPSDMEPSSQRVLLPATRWPVARRPGARLHGYYQCDPTRHAHGSGYCLTTPAD